MLVRRFDIAAILAVEQGKIHIDTHATLSVIAVPLAVLLWI